MDIQHLTFSQLKYHRELREKNEEMEKLLRDRDEIINLPQIFQTQKQRIEIQLEKINKNSHKYLVLTQELRILDKQIEDLPILLGEIDKQINTLHTYIQGLPEKYSIHDHLQEQQLKKPSKLPTTFFNKRTNGGKRKTRKTRTIKKTRTNKKKKSYKKQ